MSVERKLVSWRLSLWWMLASILGWSLASPLGLTGDILVNGSIAVATGGIGTGILQWLLLRRLISRAGWWVLASSVGIILAGTTGCLVALIAGIDAGWVVGVSVYGTVLGVLQSLVLRRLVMGSNWWVLGSTTGWIMAGLVFGLVSSILDPSGRMPPVVAWAIFGVLYGVITGPVLVWLLLHPVPITPVEK